MYHALQNTLCDRPPGNEVSVSSVTGVNSLCMYDTNNFCSYHGRLGQKRTLTKTLWKDRGGGKGYGWVKRRVTEFTCPDRKQPSGPELTQNLFSKTPQEMAVEPFGRGDESELMIGRHCFGFFFDHQ